MILRFFSSLFLLTTLSSSTSASEISPKPDSGYLKKLVRDRIPELVDASSATFHHANPDEYDHFLRMKLQEEVDEFLENPCLEEMADIVEVLEAFCNKMGTSLKEMEVIRDSKAQEKGKFQEKWIMTKNLCTNAS
jgi:predicted house-cleaning noncanonical NTP pyrophosphatase (MazG superfamily)